MNTVDKQVRSILTRWGYEPIEGDIVESSDDRVNYSRDAVAWRKGLKEVLVYSPDFPEWANRFRDLVQDLAHWHNFSVADISRLINAEPIDLNLGTVEIHTQTLTDSGEPEDQSGATICMDPHGRDRLLAALIEVEDTASVKLNGESGEEYDLTLNVVPPVEDSVEIQAA